MQTLLEGLGARGAGVSLTAAAVAFNEDASKLRRPQLVKNRRIIMVSNNKMHFAYYLEDMRAKEPTPARPPVRPSACCLTTAPVSIVFKQVSVE